MNIMEKLKQNRAERPTREAVTFTLSVDGYIADQPTCCPMCGELVRILHDQMSIREYIISGMCQKCQDSVYGE